MKLTRLLGSVVLLGVFTFALHSMGFAKEVNSAHFYTDENYFMYESSSQVNTVLIVGKVKTEVVSSVDNRTTSGLPIKTWVLQTVWEKDSARTRAAWEKAVAKNPVWKNFGKAVFEPTSQFCRVIYESPDLKVEQGTREYALDATNLICSVVLHTKNEATLQLPELIERGEVIDSGIEALSLNTRSENVSLSTRALAGKIETIVTRNAEFNEALGGFLIAHALHEISKENESKDAFKSLVGNSEFLQNNVESIFNALFVQNASGLYSLKSFGSNDLIKLKAVNVVGFDPQKKLR